MSTLQDWVRRHFGLSPTNDRFQHVVSAIRYHAQQAGCESLAEYLQRLDLDPMLYSTLIEHLSVQESYFFRVPEQFSFIRERILPEFIARNGRFDAFRAWSAGCATGEEVYSLAIVLHEAGLLDRARLLATDMSEAALKKAFGGVYRPWSFRCEDRWPIMRRYFSAVTDGQHAVDPRLRRSISFRQHNLLRSAYPDTKNGIGNLDLVFCRNVLIYFNRESAQQVVQRLQRCLAPGGWLITGPSDPLAPAVPGCETVVTAAGILYRRRTAAEDGRYSIDSGPEMTGAPGAEPPLAPVSAPASFVGRGLGGLSEELRQPAMGDRTARPVESAQPRVAQDARQGAAQAMTQALTDAVDQVATPGGAVDPAGYFDQGLQAVVAGRLEDAVTAFRKALYLDSSLIVVQLNMAAVLERLGRYEDARRACQNAYRLAASQPPESLVALVERMTAGEIMAIARKQIARMTQRRR